MKWAKDKTAEDILTSLGIKFEYRSGIRISSLLIEESKRNNARFGKPVDQDTIQLYSHHMGNGATFPALVLTKDFFILAGNHRVPAAQQAGWNLVDAYVVTEATPEQITRFIWEDNNRHGIQLTEDQRVMSAVEVHRKFKVPMTELNDRLFGGNQRTYERIKSANHAKDVEEKLQEKAVDTSKIPWSTLAQLYPINDNINVLRDTGLVIAEFGLNSNDVAQMVKGVKEKNTEAERLSFLNEYRQRRLAVVKTGKSKPEQVLKTEIAKLTKVLDTGNDGKAIVSLAELGLDAKAIKAIKVQVSSLINRLRDLTKGVRK